MKHDRLDTGLVNQVLISWTSCSLVYYIRTVYVLTLTE